MAGDYAVVYYAGLMGIDETYYEAAALDGECGYMAEYGESQRMAKKLSAYYSGTYKPGVEEEDSLRVGYEDKVATEITNISTVVKQYESLVGGELRVEETNAEFVEQLKVAGVDTVIEEMQKQVDEFMASK